MFKNTFFPIILGIVLIMISCGSGTKGEAQISNAKTSNDTVDEVSILNNRSYNSDSSTFQTQSNQLQTVIVGANNTQNYLTLLSGKKVGIVANQTTVIFKNQKTKTKDNTGYVHLVDSLVSLKIDVKTVFAPEHGFRGTADAGEHVKDGKDQKTGIPIVSLYGDNKKPKPEQLKGLDIMIFDLQDVGARFYTYISTLHYVMEACAEANIPVLILDRPNPNGDYVDGPLLEKEFTSFVGMHPIPIVHGMTIGEYGQMINGEKWLKNGIQCPLTVISMKAYTHQTHYSLPIKPSPNLPNDKAINLYPSMCLFEGTTVSVGRGTNKQFQVFGSPTLDQNFYTYNFVPRPNEGAKTPPHNGVTCYGKDLSNSETLHAINLKWIIEAYQHSLDKKNFFNDFFSKLAGTKKLRQQIEQGLSEEDIKATWQKDLNSFKSMRKIYLLYN